MPRMKYSRRQFIQGLIIGSIGTAIASITQVSSCKSSSKTIPLTSSNENNLLTDAVATRTTVIAPNASSTLPSSGVITSYSYSPPKTLPQMLIALNSTCEVAVDRLYSPDHVWVKVLTSQIAVMGITPTMVEILFNPYNIKLLDDVSNTLSKNDAFAYMEGHKMTADILSPVSGRVLQVNQLLLNLGKQDQGIGPIVSSPYNEGWLIVVLLSNIQEINKLLTAESYRNLISAVGDQ